MKTFLLLLSSFLVPIYAHTIFQKVSVNGADKGQLVGLRAPDSDYPVQDVNSASMACNTGLTHLSSAVVDIPAGAKVGAWWGHVIGGAQVANDPDNPIAKSHKGPIMAYLAKVDNAATSGTSGLKWFKVAEDTLNPSTGIWAVDTMISNGGWSYFTMPSCIAPGNYLLRVELIALHSAGTQGQAQLYMECAQINVTGGGSFSPSSTVSFPGAYKATDPGILISIYDSQGKPNNAGKAYQAPGPAPITCSAEGTTPAPGGGNSGSGSGSGSGTAIPLYGQCGGTGWAGATTCASGTCKASSDYYSQCVP